MASVRIYARSGVAWHSKYCDALLQGLRKFSTYVGVTGIDGMQPAPVGDHVDILLGPNHWRQTQDQLAAAGRQYVIVNRAWWGDPHSVAMTWNAINGWGYWPPLSDDHGDRPHPPLRQRDAELSQHVEERGHVLILGQAALHTRAWPSLAAWYARAVKDANDWCPKVPVYWRPHPVVGGEPPPGTRLMEGDLAGNIEGARIVLTLNTTAAVDALLAGVPCIAYDTGSPVYGVNQTTRVAGIQRLAAQQWTHAEIQKGVPWPHLLAQRSKAGPGLPAMPQ